MTVSNQTARISAVGTNTVGQAVPFSFPINATSDLTIISRVTATGVETTLALTTNYTVTISGDTGGTVTMVTAVATTAEIHVIRDTPQTQPLDLESSGTFNAENIEEAFDRVTRQVNDNADAIRRCVRAPETDGVSIDMELPSSVDRASKVISSDASGNVTTTDGTGNVVTNTTTTNLITKRPMVDVRFFGATADGTTDDAPFFDLAITHAVSTNRPLYIPAGTYKLDSKITISGASITILGDGSNETFLDWRVADGGLDITWTEGFLPPQIKGLTLRTNQTGGDGTALAMSFAALNVQYLGPTIEDIQIRGFIITTDSWDIGMHFTNCSTIRARNFFIKGEVDSLRPWDMSVGIKLTSCTLVNLSDFTMLHMDTGILQAGASGGEGFYFNNFEIVGVDTGIDLPGGGPGTVIFGGHINAAEFCIQLVSRLQMNIHDCLLYKTNVSTANWTALHATACIDCNFHDLNIQGSQDVAESGLSKGIVLAFCSVTKVHDNQFDLFGTTGEGVEIGTATRNCYIYNNSGSVGINPLIVVNADATADNVIYNNYPENEIARSLGSIMTYEGDVMTYEGEILLS